MHELLNQALAKWLEILKVDPQAEDAMRHVHWGDAATVEQLQESQLLDTTGLTTTMLLYGIWERYANNLTISVRKMLDHDPESLKTLADFRELRRLLSDPALVEPMREFQRHVHAGMEHYGALQAFDMVADLASLGVLRRDALRSIKTMQAFQFLQGPAVTDTLRYNQAVYQFPNIQSMITAIMAHNEYGVTLCHILDPVGLEFSYFAFGVWNGGTMTVVTDKPDWAHPLQSSMSRCPGRSLAERWGKHHFPYELLNPQFSENGKQVMFGRHEGLVLYDVEATALKGLFSLEPDVVIWVAMVFELLQEQYFRQNLRLSDLSYTADQVQTQVPTAHPLMRLESWVPPVKLWIKSQELTPETTCGNWERKPVGANDWLEHKFRDAVPDSLVNLVRDDNGKLLPPPTKSRQAVQQFRRILKQDKTALQAMSPTAFGPAADLQRDHQWFARYNQAVAIDQLAKEEFERTKETILAWYQAKLELRRDFLIDQTCRMTWPVTWMDWPFGFKKEQERHSGDWIKLKSSPKGWRGSYGITQKIGDWSNHKHCYLCPITGAKATLRQIFEVQNPEAISLITDVPVAELPEPLQHYYEKDPYTGNSILERLDPMDWVVENPWRKLRLDVQVTLSRSGFSQRRAALGLPVFRDWESLPEPSSIWD